MRRRRSKPQFDIFLVLFAVIENCPCLRMQTRTYDISKENAPSSARDSDKSYKKGEDKDSSTWHDALDEMSNVLMWPPRRLPSRSTAVATNVEKNEGNKTKRSWEMQFVIGL